jgi:hypothetical protein
MKNLMVTSEIKDQDIGLVEFSFIVDGKEYTVRPLPLKEGENPSLSGKRYNKLQDFLKYVKYIAPKKKLNPFSYPQWKQYFEIIRKGEKRQSPKQEAEQLSLKLAVEALDKISSKLEEKGAYEESYLMDIIANTLEKGWDSVKVILFADEMANQDIPLENAYKVVKVYNNGADTEHSVASITGIDSWTCKVILDAAHKHRLLK